MKRLLLDQDGPLADFDKAAWDLMEPFDKDIATLDEQQHRFLTDHLVNKSDRDLIQYTIRSNREWFDADTLPVVSGAQEGVAALLEAGVDIWVCTKPLEANPGCRDGKYRWIQRHFPELERKLVITPDKRLVHGDVLLDDAIPLKWTRGAWGPTWRPVVFAASWNAPGGSESLKYETTPRWSWSDPIDDLLAMLDGETPMAASAAGL